jgi:O-antigen ligase
VPASYVERLATVTDIESDPTNSAQSRWRDIVAAAQFVTEHPIVGAGIGMDMLALNQIRGEHWTQVHNVYFQYAVDLGVIGVVLYLFVLFGVLHGITRTCRSLETRPERRELFLFAEALRVSVIVFAVAAVFHPVAYHFYFYYIAGLTLALRSIASSPTHEPSQIH